MNASHQGKAALFAVVITWQNHKEDTPEFEMVTLQSPAAAVVLTMFHSWLSPEALSMAMRSLAPLPDR